MIFQKTQKLLEYPLEKDNPDIFEMIIYSLF